MKNLIIYTFILFNAIILISCSNKIDEVYELKELGLRAQALERVAEIIKNDPTNAEAYFAQANLQAEEGLIESALKSFEDALKIEPDNIQYNFNYIFYLMNFSKQYQSTFESKLTSFLGKYSDDPKSYVLKARYYGRENIDDYINIILKLNELIPFKDWQRIYSDEKEIVNAEYFSVFSDSQKYFDEAGNFVGYQKRGFSSKITEIIGDTILYTNPNDFKIVKAFAWKIVDAYKIYKRGQRSILSFDDQTSLYREPKLPYARWMYGRGATDNKGISFSAYISERVPSSEIEVGPIVFTGKTETFTYYPYMDHTYICEWAQVSYSTKELLLRKMLINDNLILFNNSLVQNIFQNGIKSGKEATLLKKILNANNIAINMTTDLVLLKFGSQLTKISFDRDGIIEHYSFFNHQFIFKDGLLKSINKISS